MFHPFGRFLGSAPVLSLALALAPSLAGAQGPVYSVISLHMLGTGASSTATGINIYDEVVGYSDTGGVDGSGKPVHHGFFWDAQTKKLTDIFPADTQLTSEAHGVNLFGEVGGFNHTDPTNPATTHAYLYTQATGPVSDTYTNNNWLYAINNSGQGFGTTFYNPNGPQEEATYQLYNNSMFGLGNGQGQNATAYAAADPTPEEGYGDSAGLLYPGGGYTPHAYYNAGFGAPMDVSGDGTVYGPPAAAYAMNNGGVATGYTTYLPTGLHVCVLFSKWAGGVSSYLGTLPGQQWSEGHGMNEFDQVVGKSGPFAFVSDSYYGMRDLNGLIGQRSGWIITDAAAINDVGDIVGQGYFQGHLQALLLVPVVLNGFTLNATTVKGGQPLTGTLTLSAPAPFPIAINLTSDSSSVSVPKTVAIAQGDTTIGFSITTKTVTKQTVVNLRAAFGGIKLPVQVTVTP